MLEELAHVEVAWTHVDAFRAVLDTLLVYALGQLFEGLLVSVLPILSHKQASKCDIQGGSVALELFPGDRGVLGSSATIVTSSIVSTLQKVPICGDQELFCFLEFGASHSDVCLSEDEVSWEQLNRLLIEDLLFDCLAHSVIDSLVGVLVLIVNDILLGLFDRLRDFFPLSNKNEK